MEMNYLGLLKHEKAKEAQCKIVLSVFQDKSSSVQLPATFDNFFRLILSWIFSMNSK